MKYFRRGEEGAIIQPGVTVFVGRHRHDLHVSLILMLRGRRWWKRPVYAYAPWQIQLGVVWTVFCKRW